MRNELGKSKIFRFNTRDAAALVRLERFGVAACGVAGTFHMRLVFVLLDA